MSDTRAPAPPGGSDYFMIVGLRNVEPESEVFAAAALWIATGDTEEEAVAKVAAIEPDAKLFTAQVVPTFPPPTIERHEE